MNLLGGSEADFQTAVDDERRKKMQRKKNGGTVGTLNMLAGGSVASNPLLSNKIISIPGGY